MSFEAQADWQVNLAWASLTLFVTISLIGIPAKSKAECLKEYNGVLNNQFVRCRNGRQEYVQYNSKNERMVLRERPIPMN